jgi:hypothetical protein
MKEPEKTRRDRDVLCQEPDQPLCLYRIVFVCVLAVAVQWNPLDFGAF